MSCREAILTYWPADTQAQALIVMNRESGGIANRTHVNSDHAYKDGHNSTDYGCLQLNDYWHFGTNGWTNINQAFDPAWNIKYALTIYQHRGWSAWYGAKGIYW